MATILPIPPPVPTHTSAGIWNVKLVVALVVLLVLLLLVVEHYPRVIIGFMLLVLVGVILSHADIVTPLLKF